MRPIGQGRGQAGETHSSPGAASGTVVGAEPAVDPAPQRGSSGGATCRIGELARRAGVTVRTVRYYEELGILESSDRRGSRHRRYCDRDLVRLERVHQLKAYGLSLGEIREIFDLAREDPTGERSRLRLLSRYREKHREAEGRKQRLESYLEDLEWHIDQLQKVNDFQACPGEECLSCRYTGLCKFYNRPAAEGEDT